MTLTNPIVQNKLNEWQSELRDLTGDNRVIITAFRPVPVIMQLEELCNIICEETGISLIAVRGKTRKTNVVMARHLIAYYARLITRLSLTDIGIFIGNKDHTTIIHGKKHIQDLLETQDPVAVELVAKITKRLESIKPEA